MEIIIDECVAKSTRLCLIDAGFKIIKVEDVLNPGIDDKKIFEYANKNNLAILTHDRGFGVLYHFSKDTHPTVIILQVLSPHPEATNNLLKNTLLKIDLNKPKYQRKLIIVSKKNIRIRSK